MVVMERSRLPARLEVRGARTLHGRRGPRIRTPGAAARADVVRCPRRGRDDDEPTVRTLQSAAPPARIPGEPEVNRRCRRRWKHPRGLALRSEEHTSELQSRFELV